MEKIVILINGRGGAGKDTLCGFASRTYQVKTISAITPIKEIARNYGWNGAKDRKSRKFLSDLKRVFIEYNDLPTNYLYDEYQKFLKSKNQILFVHIREKEEIEKFKKLVDIRCVTLLIVRPQNDKRKWGNTSDDDVDTYQYDYYYVNEKPIEDAAKDFTMFLETVLGKGENVI